jgi:hypothetical protein
MSPTRFSKSRSASAAPSAADDSSNALRNGELEGGRIHSDPPIRVEVTKVIDTDRCLEG